VPTEIPSWEGRSARDWSLTWQVPRVHLFQSVGSTNDLAKDFVRAGHPALTVVLAEEQTRGRGRTGGAWISPPGVGLWMSMVVAGRTGPALTLLPLLVGLGVARAVERVTDSPRGAVKLKWPNDVLVQDRKVCGVLCEASGGSGTPVVVGVGINVLQDDDAFPPELMGVAGSLKSTLGASVSRGELAGAVVQEAIELARLPRNELGADLRSEWQERDAWAGRLVTVTGPAGSVLGRAGGITREGQFLLEKADGETLEVHSGTVRLVPEGDSHC